ncbi:MAG TPA: ubiquinol-cytochrome c reductase iron-sulfur subunit [Phycisphaerae bacterium]
MTRRSWLDAVLKACGFVTLAGLLAPALSYLWPVTRRGPGAARKEIADAAGLKPWSAVTDVVGGKPVIVVMRPEGPAAFSAVCTHLGCIVQWNAEKRAFLCPCHAAVFDADGQVASGPPPKPLPSYTVTRVGEKIYVST